MTIHEALEHLMIQKSVHEILTLKRQVIKQLTQYSCICIKGSICALKNRLKWHMRKFREVITEC